MPHGKSAIVTGSTSGIGQGIARALAKAGANVMLNGLGDDASVEADRAALAAETGVQVAYSNANMTKPDEIAAMVAEANRVFGSVDILINNAGIQHVAPVDEFPAEKWDAILAINLSASFHTIRHALPLMKAKKWGRVVNIASAHALVASPYKSAYVAAKHGIAGLTKTVALEAAEHGITMNAICPGYVWTPLVEGQVADTAKARGISEEEVKRDVLLKAQPTKQFTTITQIAEFVLFLCSDAGANLTGAVLPIDGGWTAQ
jgi:3-hydroxybutyrate dehydrogenase